MTIFFKIFVHSFAAKQTMHQTTFAANQTYFIQRVSTNSGKNKISFRGAALWTEIKQISEIFAPWHLL